MARLARVTLAAALAGGCTTRDVFLVPGGTAEAGLDAAASGAPPEGGFSTRDGALPACVREVVEARPRPLGVHVMVDQSSSMAARWDAVTAALGRFFEQAAGASVGLSFFPLAPALSSLPFVPGWATACTAADYAVPSVAIAPVDDPQRAALEAALAAAGPTSIERALAAAGLSTVFLGDSPTAAALEGAIAAARAWQAAEPGEAIPVVLLVTDGGAAASGCSSAVADVAAAAEVGIAGEPPVRTFVLGVAAGLDLGPVAAAGGTGAARSATDPGALDGALETVRQEALPCSVVAREQDLGESSVNVRFREPGGSPQELVRVEGPTACSAELAGWYWPGGSEIVLCPATCSVAQAVTDATLEVSYGCSTRTL